MNSAYEKHGRLYQTVTIAAGFVSPFSNGPFSCLLWDHVGCSGDAERAIVARVLLDAGCRYVVCGGRQCEAWHDAIDVEFVARHHDEPKELWAAVHVMTTWHAGQSPDQTAFFFVALAELDGRPFRRNLVLHVGARKTRATVDTVVRKHASRLKAND